MQTIPMCKVLFAHRLAAQGGQYLLFDLSNVAAGGSAEESKRGAAEGGTHHRGRDRQQHSKQLLLSPTRLEGRRQCEQENYRARGCSEGAEARTDDRDGGGSADEMEENCRCEAEVDLPF